MNQQQMQQLQQQMAQNQQQQMPQQMNMTQQMLLQQQQLYRNQQAQQQLMAQQLAQKQQQQQFQRNAPAPAPVDPTKNKRKRPTDNVLPKKIEAYVPEAKIYQNMLELEKRVDATIMRKTLDIQDVLQKPSKKIPRTLRIFLSNIAANQDGPGDAKSSPADSAPSWTFKIEGKLLDLPGNCKTAEPCSKFSSFVKKIVVEVDRDNQLYPGNLIEWNKPATGHTEVDGFEIKRRGDQEVDLKIMVHLETSPEKHKLSPSLAKLLDIQIDTLPNVIMGLWQYAKSHRLQDVEDRRIFQTPKIAIPNLPSLLSRQMFPCDPISLSYTIRLDKEYSMSPQAYDVTVEVTDPIRDTYVAAGQASVNMQKEIAVLDEKISTLVQSINVSKLKRDYMTSFSNDPVNFINKWIASQSRDLEVILGDTRMNLEEAQSNKFFENDKFQEALFHYLRSKDLQ